MLTDIIPAAWRARVYAVYALIGLALGVTQTVYLTTATAQPGWLTASLAVYAVVGTAIGSVAKANVPTQDPQPTPAASPSTTVQGGVTTFDPGDGSPTTTTLS